MRWKKECPVSMRTGTRRSLLKRLERLNRSEETRKIDARQPHRDPHGCAETFRPKRDNDHRDPLIHAFRRCDPHRSPKSCRRHQGHDAENDSVIHKLFLKNGVILVEYPATSGITDYTRDYQFAAHPMKIKESDGAPARVILIEKEK